MTKQELNERIHEQAGEGLSRKTTAEVVDAILDAVTKSVIEDKKFFYPSFGTFELKHRKARVGRNPRTGEQIQIPARNTVGFKPASALKKSVNED